MSQNLSGAGGDPSTSLVAVGRKANIAIALYLLKSLVLSEVTQTEDTGRHDLG